MKHLLRVTSIVLFSLLLASCDKNEQPKKTFTLDNTADKTIWVSKEAVEDFDIFVPEVIYYTLEFTPSEVTLSKYHKLHCHDSKDPNYNKFDILKPLEQWNSTYSISYAYFTILDLGNGLIRDGVQMNIIFENRIYYKLKRSEFKKIQDEIVSEYEKVQGEMNIIIG